MKGIDFIRAMIVVASMLAIQGCDTAGDFDDPDKDYFLKYYGNTKGNQKGVDMIVNSDGSIVIAGESENAGQRRIYFLKVDAMGKVMVEKYFSGPSEEVKDIEPLGNDTYIIAADYLTDRGDLDIKLIKISGAGEVLDSATYGIIASGPDSENPSEVTKSITVLSTGDILVAGASFPVIDESQFMIYRFTSSLDIDNSWQFGQTNMTDVNVIAKVLETGGTPSFCAVGYTNSDLTNDNPEEKTLFAYIGLDDTGGGLLPGGFSGAINLNDTEINSGITTASFDPGYFVTGITKGTGSDDLFICKLRKELVFAPGNNSSAGLYTKIKPSGSNSLAGIAAVSSASSPLGYLVIGNDVQSSGNSNIWLSKIGLDGQVNWSARFGSEQGSDTAGSIAELPDGKILILGTVELGDNQKKLTLMKLNSKGQFLK